MAVPLWALRCFIRFVGPGFVILVFWWSQKLLMLFMDLGWERRALLFSRVGGEFFTKSADVGADLVGKVEAGIPEDDPRNPGVIADNVEDNVGDIAGMGSDIFESYCGSMIATVAIASTLALSTAFGVAALAPDGGRESLMALPLLLASLGLVCSVVGIILVNMLSSLGPERALELGHQISAILLIIAGYFLVQQLG